MSYIVLTERGSLKEWRDETQIPEPGLAIGEDVVCLVADGPDAEPLEVWEAMMVAEMAQVRRLMLN
ncbi:MAG: hypothetical protein ACYCW6_17755 [Candidatus Xenobia bacterium]